MKKTASFIVVLLLLASMAYVVLGPFIALYGIKQGIDENNQAKLEQYIDFPELRKNIKNKVREQIMDSLGFDTDDTGNMLAQFAINFTDKLIDLGVDGAISPSGLSLIMSGNDLNDVMLGAKNKNVEERRGGKKSFTELIKNSDFNYVNSHEFICILKDVEESENDKASSTELVFYRKGIHWKLSDVIFEVNQDQFQR